MRRPLSLSAVAAAALLLAACSGEAGGTDGPQVSGEFGEQPTLTFPDSDPPAELTVDVVSEGDGEEVAEGDFVVADYIGQVWGADATFDDSFARGQVAGFSLDQVIQGWQQGLPGTHVGDRVLLSIPSDLGYPEGNPDAGIAAGDTLVFVVDVVAAFGSDELAGQSDAVDTGELAELPVTVSGELGQPATVAVKPDAAAPEELAMTTIAEGSGEVVGDSGSVIVSFAATGWDGTDGGSTWDYGAPEAIALGGGTVFDELVGVPVGSRVIALMPGGPETPAIAAVIDVVGYVG
jgi:peptidylprolyl isomerase